VIDPRSIDDRSIFIMMKDCQLPEIGVGSVRAVSTPPERHPQ
jgi:hypothetical protein